MTKLFVMVLMTNLTGSFSSAARIGEWQQSRQEQGKASAAASAKSQAETSVEPGALNLTAGSQINAEMASTLDLKNAKPGTPFKMKTTRPLKSDGKEIISRGSTITGHVEQITRSNKTTSAVLVFDQLQDKTTHLISPLSAVVTAVTRAETAANAIAQQDMIGSTAGGDQQVRSQQRSSQPSGGLLGGVTQTVSGATQTAAGVTGPIGSTVSSTTNANAGANSGIAGATGGLTRGTIQIISNTTGNADAASTLALPGNKIEGGTKFVLQTTSGLVLSKQAKQQ